MFKDIFQKISLNVSMLNLHLKFNTSLNKPASQPYVQWIDIYTIIINITIRQSLCTHVSIVTLQELMHVHAQTQSSSF